MIITKAWKGCSTPDQNPGYRWPHLSGWYLQSLKSPLQKSHFTRVNDRTANMGLMQLRHSIPTEPLASHRCENIPTPLEELPAPWRYKAQTLSCSLNSTLGIQHYICYSNGAQSPAPSPDSYTISVALRSFVISCFSKTTSERQVHTSNGSFFYRQQ